MTGERRKRFAITVALLLGLALGAAPPDAPAAAGDTTADRVLGQPDFTTNTAASGATGLHTPHYVAVDPGSGRIYVADFQNNRVLSWPSATTFTNGQAADRVIDQPDFVSVLPNQGHAPTASTLSSPQGMAVDSTGNLYVADYSNSRMLIYNAPTSTGMSASRVIGQSNFTSFLPNRGGAISASTLNLPAAVALDAAGNLYVSDQQNHRVLEYGAPLTSDQSANRVFGEPGMGSAICNNGGRSASSLCNPNGIAVDNTGSLYVADTNNSRVLKYDQPLTTDSVADRVYGQPDFTGLVISTGTASLLGTARGVAVDASNNLYVVDFNRVLEFDDTVNGDAIGDHVFGQAGSFTTNLANKGGLSADSLSGAVGVAVDSSGNLYVADTGNNRALGFDQPVSGASTGKSFTAPSATGTGDITASFTGGGASCAFSNPQFIGAPPGSPPVPPTLPAPGVDFPHGMFAFSAVSCTPGSTLSFTIVYPQALPPGTVYYKYGPTTGDPTPHWYTLPATVVGNTITFSITDGGLGDDDLAANGTIVDQGGPGAPQGSAPAAAIPTLSEWMLLLLPSIVGVIAIIALRRSSGPDVDLFSCKKPEATMRTFSRTLASLVLGIAFAGAQGTVTHPMDPLEDSEILAAATILLNAHAAQPGAIFQSIDLREPPKAAVLAFPAGPPIPRTATVFYRQNKQSFKTIVNLTQGTFTAPILIPKSQGQLGLTIGEVFDFSFAFNDSTFLKAMKKRGLTTPEQLAHVFVTPLTPGSFGMPEESRRIVKAQMYYTQGAGINLYAKPIEGIQAIIDLDEKKVIQVIDTGVIPLATDTQNFDEASVAARYGLRPVLKPLQVTQPQGANFAINGNFVEWQKWRFHVRFERRPGTIISLATYDGRSVMYQGSLSEIFIPYQDPDTNWYYRTYMDAGEFGVGLLASPLALGLDVPSTAVLIDAVVSAAIPDPELPVIPLPLPNVIGIFERLTGNPAWRHFELFANAYEGRAEVELVVRTIAQVGNYDYMVDWIFTQRGSMRVEVGLTGIDASKGVQSSSLSDPTSQQDTRFGALVSPNLVATNHSHHFNFRLDLDVDGRNNSFILGRLKVKDDLHDTPRSSVWVVDEGRIDREQDAQLDENNSVWKVINPHRKNARGYNTGYIVESHASAEPLLKKADYKRAQFIAHNLWVTAFDPDERFAAGDTPNENPGEPGLPQYIANNQSLVDTDIVLWLTVGFHHIPAAEDFPVLPRETLSFEIKPANFFDRNPALDLRRAPFEVLP